MVKSTFWVSLFAIFLVSCRDNSTTNQATDVTDSSQNSVNSLTIDDGNPFIPVDTANIMIKSYLNSINYTSNDTDLHSLIVDAQALRAYLTNDSNGRRITKMKIMFAHTMSYIDSGGTNQNAGYQSKKLTLILAGFDENNNYVYFPGNRVMNHATPCPTICPQLGTAARDTLASPILQ